MIITQHAIVMVFGALLAIAGIVLLVIRNDQAQNRIKLFGQEFRNLHTGSGGLSRRLRRVHPSVGDAFKESTDLRHTAARTNKRAGAEPRDGRHNGRRHEPNNEIGAANLISLNTTVKGAIAPGTDQDVFKIQTANPGAFQSQGYFAKENIRWLLCVRHRV